MHAGGAGAEEGFHEDTEYRHLLMHAVHECAAMFVSTHNTALVSENGDEFLGHACRW